MFGRLTSYFLVLVIAVFDTTHEDGGLVGEDQAILVQVPVAGVEHGVEHGLVQQEVSHPLGDDDVDLGERKLNLLHLALDKGDLVGQAVLLHDFPRLEDDGGHINTNDMLGAGLGSKHGKNGGAAAHIENDLVLEQVLVLDDRVHVRFCADFVFLRRGDHLLAGLQVAKKVEVEGVACTYQHLFVDS